MLRKIFRTTLLAGVSALTLGAGAANAQNIHFDDSQYTNLTNTFQDICVPQTNLSSQNSVTMVQQQTAEQALFALRSSRMAATFLDEQGDEVCLSGYDVPVQVDRGGMPLIPGERIQKNQIAQTALLMVDKLVNGDLNLRGYPESGNWRPQTVDDHFRMAVRIAMTAEILQEMKDSGYPDAYNAATQSRYGSVFRAFGSGENSLGNNAYDGTAHVRAIREYFRSHYRTPRMGHYSEYGGIRGESIYGNTQSAPQASLQSLYGMGERPDKPNIFEASFLETGFNLHYFLQAAPRNNPIFSPPHGHKNRY
ncbi:MAG: hypothetical protein HND56_01455 [Pseudomonadota bacterium]|nr:hypothetical protein [Pseudomonadota bacterium]QKK04429.1 MAG: hypothetical protein HND56_01455 [Pseudomonadota bacterium]